MATTQVFKLSEYFPDFTLSPERPHFLSLSKQQPLPGNQVFKGLRLVVMFPLTPPQFFTGCASLVEDTQNTLPLRNAPDCDVFSSVDVWPVNSVTTSAVVYGSRAFLSEI